MLRNAFWGILTILLFLLTTNAIATESPYHLAPGDTLEIKHINKSTLNTKQTITPDGTISLPLIGRKEVRGKTLSELDDLLDKSYAVYIQRPEIIVYLTPRPIHIIQHDIRKNTWEVKEANSLDEAYGLVGKDYQGNINYGDRLTVEIGKKPDFWEDNWYKLITATAVLVGIVSVGR